MKRIPKWLRDIPADQRPRFVASLYRGLKDARQFFSGFEARDGFTLNRLDELTKKQVDKLRETATYIHELQARSPAKIYQPRSANTKRLIQKRTGQTRKNQKRFLIRDAKPEDLKVKARGNRLEFQREFKAADGTAHRLQDKYYYFNFARRPRSFEDLMRLASKVVPHLPKGRYTILNSQHGEIDVPQEREGLLQVLRNWFESGGSGRHVVTDQIKKGFAESIIGFKWVGIDRTQSDAYYQSAQYAQNVYRERLRLNRQRQKREATKRSKRRGFR